MCSGSKNKVAFSNSAMESKFQKLRDGALFSANSILLELSASDDVDGFKREVEERDLDVDEPSCWYGRGIGSKKMGFEERTPLMIAAMYGSSKVVKYLIETGKVDINRACGSDMTTALHCASAGGSGSSLETIKLLLDGSADVDCVDANGRKPVDLIVSACRMVCYSGRKAMEMLLRGDGMAGVGDLSLFLEEDQQKISASLSAKEGSDKKEYPVDISLPDINSGIYGTDDFRMYTFKVKPCSRAYSHDWTECPFVHPGENARRRDPKKYPYSCVPCPEFRKGACPKGDSCEYAHGVFESWLHPAQYRTRLCKDETGCTRKVCFFAHRPDELRPVYASTGSGMPSPRSLSSSAADMSTMSPLALGSSSLSLPTASTPPMSPLASVSSPKNGNLWQNKINLTPPALQLPGSRLKATLSARDLDLEMELLGLEKNVSQMQHQQQLIDEISRLSAPSYWSADISRSAELKPSNLDDMFGSLDSSLLSQLQGTSLKTPISAQVQSPTGLQMRQNMNQLRASYPANLSSSPVKKPSSFGFDSSSAVAAAVMNSRSAAFAKRSQSFIDRAAVTRHPGVTGAANSASTMSSHLSDWNSPDGKLDWGMHGNDLNKLKKSASFGIRNNSMGTPTFASPVEEPDVSWVNSLVKDVPSDRFGMFGAEKRAYNLKRDINEMIPSWMEQQLYAEQEQTVA
ncbi:zinc finger CCCH domain-containing protein 29-like [Cucurbita pepo subsp. pepo]|uniref:zinc finger CCCH domain-containing protein 29-like n=1 Tax=Cucurbita pepo subsp. pepo TaxID=3664 RepID=UPI000C9D43AC|nr:zinc finger CCCH domain-containing protein 29-like [Cucurbita pepo subsp. pepo]